MSTHTQLLTGLLEAAADGIPGAAEKFFQTLLDATVYVVLREDLPSRVVTGPTIVGERSLSELPYQTVQYEGRETLPIFSEPEFAEVWAKREVEIEPCEFKKLLWQVGEDNWFYINAAQEVGKEITAWEIAQLRKGVDAIPELVSELEGDEREEFSIRPEADLYPDLKRALLPVLEIYPELEEAFLVGMTEGEGSAERPVLGLKYGSITEAKRIYLRAELERVAAESLSDTEQVFIVEDLGDAQSANWELFTDATPFYVGQRKMATDTAGPLQKAFGKFKQLFSSRSGSKPSKNRAE